jgi:hypothetical protein
VNTQRAYTFNNFDCLVKQSQALLASNLARDNQTDGDSGSWWPRYQLPVLSLEAMP